MFLRDKRYAGGVVLLVAVLLAGCGKKENCEPSSDEPELILYCGITMIAPMTEIAELIERQEHCRIHITKGGSGNLLKSILYNQTGDLYLPGSDRYFKIIDEEHAGLVTERTAVGQNKAVLLVQKGNPCGFKGDLKGLSDRKFGVVIGDPDSGSIGKEARAILERAGMFEAVVQNAMMLATDSKDILKSIKSGQADVGINWYATYTWGDNSDFVDVVEIDPSLAKSKTLVLGTLKYTRYPEICRAVQELASSEQGHDIFRKHGLYFDSE